MKSVSPWGKSGFGSAVLLALALSLPNVGRAGVIFDPPVPDHLKCYRIKDSLPVEHYRADLANQFGLEQNCRIRTPARFLCAETVKRIQRPQPPGGGPSGTPAGHFLCYMVRCEDGPEIPEFFIEDQFGRRAITIDQERLLCAPADKFICGDGDLDPGEQCDPSSPDAGLCPDGTPCTDDCRCPINECECGTPCTTPDGIVGDCRPTGSAATDPCECVPEIPDCLCGDTCVSASGNPGECRPTDPTNPNDCTCVEITDCPCGVSCTSPSGELGHCRPIPGSNLCDCVPDQPDCLCGDTCVSANGNPGECRPTDPTNPNDCSCVEITDCPCGVSCTSPSGDLGHCRPIPGSNLCDCVPDQSDCPCGTTCISANGNPGECRPTDPTNPSECSCIEINNCPCGVTCTSPSRRARPMSSGRRIGRV